MAQSEAQAYEKGFRAAVEAIEAGVPRWFVSQTCDEREIDSGTELPIATLSGPPELAASNEAFIRGFNDEILRARSAGEFTIDFRPLLLSRGEVLGAFRTQRLGTLSLDCP
jgi:hypothetical protein